MTAIRLYHPHTHDGVLLTPPPEGIALDVNEVDAAFLTAAGVTTPPVIVRDVSVVVDASTHAANDIDAEAISDTDTAIVAPRTDRRARAALPADDTATEITA